MKKTIVAVLLALCFIIINNQSSKGDWNFDPKLKFNTDKNFTKEKISRDYDRARRMHLQKTGAIIGASLDLQLGYGTTSATADIQSTGGEAKTTSKGGFAAGALLNVNLFNILNLSTGLDFTKKNFGITIPKILTPSVDSVTQNLTNNYLNIPMNVNFGGMISEKIGFNFSGGPYFGILLNAQNAVSGFKDFDFGLNGILTGKYYLNPFVAIILGTKAQYGGLNNLISTNSLNKLRTVNWGGFSGVSVGF
jgi:hypothetical protein